MNVLLLCWRDSAHPQGGGSERYLERVGAYLARRGHTVEYRTAYQPDDEHQPPADEIIDGVYHRRRGGTYGVYVRAFIDMALARIGRGPYRDIDVIVDTQNGIPFFSTIAHPAPTVLLTHHCHKLQWPVAGPVLARIGWWIEGWLSPRIHRHTSYVTVSENSARELTCLAVRREHITVIRNGVDHPPAGTPVRVPEQPGGPIRLVTLSRLVPHKHIEDAIDVAASLRETRPVELTIIGSGWWEDNLKTYAARHGQADWIHFTGQVDEQQKHQLLAASDIHLMPSRKEGWGLAVMEAALHGVPTIGYTHSGGLNDSVAGGVTGMLVDTKQQLLEAAAQLSDDAGLRRRLGQAARRRAAGMSWDDTGAAFETLLKKQLGESARPQR